jgi:DNA-binding CsgD family transcriptional regulator
MSGKPTARSGTFALGFGTERCVNEHARFAQLHRGLISTLLQATGGAEGICYCGDYLASGLLVGSKFDKGDIVAVEPLDFESFRERDADFGLEPVISGWHDALPPSRFEAHVVDAARAAQRFAWLPLVIGSQVSGIVGVDVAEGRSGGVALAEVRSRSEHCSSFADIFLRHQELTRWLDVTNHLASFDGVCAVVDGGFSQLLWVGARGNYAELQQEVRENAAAMISVVARSASSSSADPPVSYPVLSNGTVVHVQAEKTLSTFSGQAHAVVAIRPHRVENDDDVTAVLSRREHQVARLLGDGYTIVNAAAILGLTENTVRTYVRRLYRKLGVNTRTDLVRQLQAQLA